MVIFDENQLWFTLKQLPSLIDKDHINISNKISANPTVKYYRLTTTGAEFIFNSVLIVHTVQYRYTR